MIKKNKAQIQTMEMIFILFIFFVLLVIGFIFFTRMSSSTINEDKREVTQQQAVQIAQRVADMPELMCTKKNNQKENCVDYYKLDAAKQIIGIDNPDSYFDMFGYSTIAIRQILPVAGPWTIYDKEYPNYKTISTLVIPVIIYNPTAAGYCYIGQGSCSFGIIEVKLYS